MAHIWGETFSNFQTLGSLEVHEDEVWQSYVYGDLFSIHQGLSTLKVSETFARPFSRNAAK
jgi:hypothetical protein